MRSSSKEFDVILTVRNPGSGVMSSYSDKELRSLARDTAKGKGRIEHYWLAAHDLGGISLIVQYKGRDGWVSQESVRL